MIRRNFLKKSGAISAGLYLSHLKNGSASSVMEHNNIANGAINGKESLDIEIFKVIPQDHGKALINPDMGWTMQFYSNILKNYGSQLEPSDTLDDFPGLSTVYLRIPWAFVEPQEGKFVWETLDTPAQRWIEKGKKVAFRISAMESWMSLATPQWVFDAGAKSYEVDQKFEPDYGDPVFLEKAEKFVAEMGKRYDGNPNVAFVDVGHYGMWGEGHTVGTSPKHGKWWGIDVQKQHIDLYCRHFKHTQLCISDDYAGHNLPGDRFPITDYAFSRGVTLRDDSILVGKIPWYHSEMAQLFWPTMPVILEHEHYGSSKGKGFWKPELLEKSVEDYHASYMSIHWWPRTELEENREVIDRINRRMGYRIRLNAISWPKEIGMGEILIIQSVWSNAGVAPCYKGGYPCFTLKDEKGGIVSVLTDESFNVRELSVAEPEKVAPHAVTSSFKIAPAFQDKFGVFSRACQPGTYTLYVSVGLRDGTPVFKLPYSEHDGHKRYRMGQITINKQE